MMMMRTGRITDCQTLKGAILVMAITMTMARVRSTHRAVRKRPGKRSEQMMGRGK